MQLNREASYQLLIIGNTIHVIPLFCVSYDKLFEKGSTVKENNVLLLRGSNSFILEKTLFRREQTIFIKLHPLKVYQFPLNFFFFYFQAQVFKTSTGGDQYQIVSF